MLELNKIHCGDTKELLKTLPDESINCCVTSPPYWGLRDYGRDGQVGLEETPEEFIQNMVEIFREVKRALRKDGTLWLNLGDTYAANRGYQVPDSKHTDVGNKTGMKAFNLGLKPKDLIGIPWRVALALQADGWYLRQDIIWHKPNPMPESVTDRCTKSHEYIFLMSKSERYFYDHEAIKEPFADDRMGNPGPSKQIYANDPITGKGIRGQGGPSIKLQEEGWNKDGETSGRNKRSVWTVTTKPFKKAHFATFPPKLIEPCILAGCPKGGVVLDPFLGAGTTAFVSAENNRNYIGFELNSDYVEISETRIRNAQPQLF